MIFEIKLNGPKDIEKLNSIASDYDGKLIVNCGSTSIDAKSILSLFTLIGRKGIHLVAPDHDNPNKFVEVVKKLS